MSYGETPIQKMRTYGIMMILALLGPVIVSFIIWIVGSVFAAGGGMAPGITYGIYQITSSNAPANYTIPPGVSYLWINSPAYGGILNSPSFPTPMVYVLNDLIILASALVAIFAGIEFMVSLFSYYAERH
ncbi:MAG: hypothetical protein RXN79_03355 [Candidatus Nanopusillus sp.]